MEKRPILPGVPIGDPARAVSVPCFVYREIADDYLTRRLQAVLWLASLGLRQVEIADILGTRIGAIFAASNKIKVRLHARSLTHAISIGFQLGILVPTDPTDPPNLERAISDLLTDAYHHQYRSRPRSQRELHSASAPG